MGTIHYTFKSGTRLGRRRDGTDVLLEQDRFVEVTIDDEAVYAIALRAARAKGLRARSGPVVAKARKTR